jgi:hypothetical protein
MLCPLLTRQQPVAGQALWQRDRYSGNGHLVESETNSLRRFCA